MTTLTYAKNFRLAIIILAAFLLSFSVMAQSPCSDCIVRWDAGAGWEANGAINESPATGDPAGIVACASAAATQSNIGPSCTYDASMFDLPALTNCINPDTGEGVALTLPVDGQPITWFQFDVRPNAGAFDFQVIGGPDNIGWALFYSNKPTTEYNTNGLTGDCGDLTYDICGSNFNGWAGDPFITPTINKATNYYIMVWDQDATTKGGDFSFNFKARYGCGELTDPCSVSITSEPEFDCDEVANTYTVSYQFTAANGDFAIVDNTGMAIEAHFTPSSTFSGGTTSAPTTGTVSVTYPMETDYNFNIDGPTNCDVVGITGTPLCVVAPVEMAYFEASCTGEEVELEWATATEINNAYFLVERGNDGRNYSTIGKIEGVGNSTDIVEYSFVDEAPRGNVLYYRLKQVDFDGTFEYTDVVTVSQCGKAKVAVNLFPNPTVDRVTIDMGIQEENTSINVMDITGKVMMSTEIAAGENQKQLEVAHLPAGTYIVNIGGAQPQAKKFVKQGAAF